MRRSPVFLLLPLLIAQLDARTEWPSNNRGPPQKPVGLEDSFTSPMLPMAAPQTPRGRGHPAAPPPRGHPEAPEIPAYPPAPAPSFNCSGKPDGIHVARKGTCANTFWKCTNGHAFSYNCPGDLFYNEHNGQCDYRTNVAACGGVPPTPVPTGGAAPPAPPKVPGNAPFDCTGKADGLHAFAQSCASPFFFTCVREHSTVMECGPGMVYDAEGGRCAFEDQCGKGKEQPKRMGADILEHGTSTYYFGGQYQQQQIVPDIPAPQPPKQPEVARQPPQQPPLTYEKVVPQLIATPLAGNFSCAGKWDGHYIQHNCHNHYVVCSNNHTYPRNCPAGLVFDAAAYQCEHPEECHNRQQPQKQAQPRMEPEPSVSSAGKVQLPQPPHPAYPSPFNCANLYDGNYDWNHQCQPTYIVCSNRQAVEMFCPEGLVFDTSTGACEYKDQCGKNKTEGYDKAQQLPPKQEHHGEQVAPQPPQPAPATPEPGNFSCDGQRDGHYIQHNCRNDYVVCSDNKTHPRNCPAGLVFDVSKYQCERPENCGKNNTATLAPPPLPSVAPPPLSSAPSVAPPPSPPVARPRPPLPPHHNGGFRCAGRVDGYYYKQACTPQFYTCVGNHAVQLTCPGNLVFDPSRAMCQYLHACSLHPAQLAPSVGHAPSPPQPPPAPVDFHCGTRRNGYYVRTPCASEFYACLGKRAIKMACPGRLVFDTRTMSCQYPEVCARRGGGSYVPPLTQSPLPSLPPPPPPSSPPPPPQIPLPPSVVPQPPQIATPPQPPTTYSPSTPKPSAPPTPAVPQPRPGPLLDHGAAGGFCTRAGKQAGMHAEHACGASYYACAPGGLGTRLECPLGLFFNAHTGQCDYRDNVAGCIGAKSASPGTQPLQPSPRSEDYAAPPANCSGREVGYYSQGCSSEYISCAGHAGFTLRCPQGLKYAQASGQCNYDSNVPECGGSAPPPPPVPRPIEPPTPTSPPPTPAPVQHPHQPTSNPCVALPNGTYGPRCSAFYFVCTGGKPREFLCQPGLVYHAPIDKCLPKMQVPGCAEAPN